MYLERVDPMTLDDELADELAAIMNAQLAVDAPLNVPARGASLRGQARFGHDMRPWDYLWMVRDDDDRPIGHASLETSAWDNPHLALIFARVRPECDVAHVGGLLLGAQREAAREVHRTMLLTFTHRDTPTEKFLVSQGFEIAQRNAQRRLRPQELDYENIEQLANDAADHAADYELLQLDGPAPEDWVPQIGALFEAINDAPLDGIDAEHDSFPLERVRLFDEASVARLQHVYRLMARHRETGAWAGHTILCVDETRPGVSFQEDTSVIREHRGHRLGLLLKAKMLLWMRERQPELTSIDTWNAETNAHMIAVNELLGCAVISRGSVLQLHLP